MSIVSTYLSVISTHLYYLSVHGSAKATKIELSCLNEIPLQMLPMGMWGPENMKIKKFRWGLFEFYIFLSLNSPKMTLKFMVFAVFGQEGSEIRKISERVKNL